MAPYPDGEPTVTVAVRLREDFDPAAVDKDGFVLEVAEPLPDFCMIHGKPAVARRDKGIGFIRTDEGWQQTTATNRYQAVVGGMPKLVFSGPRVPAGALDGNGLLEGEWPVCLRCLGRAQWVRWIAYALAVSGFVMLYAAFVLWTTGHAMPIPLIVAIFPGWFPFGLAAAMLFYRSSSTYVHCLQILDMTKVVFRAHPKFTTALAARRSSPGG